MPAGGLLVGGMLAGGAAGALPGLFGVGKSGYQAQPFGPGSAGYNPNAANSGLNPGHYGSLGDAAGGRGPIQANNQNPYDSRNLGMQSRGDQGQALGLLRQRAMGNGLTTSEIVGRRMLEQAMANQQSQVASARGGPGAQGLAARGAMLAGAQTRGDLAGQTAANAAQERLAAQNAYFAGASGMRGQDMNLQGLDQSYALGQGNLALGSRGQNDAYQLGLYGLQNQAGLGQAGLNVQQQGILAGSQNSANTINAGTAQYNAGVNAGNFNTAIGGAMGGAQLGMMYGMQGGGGYGGQTPGLQPGQQGNPNWDPGF